ncbi:serine/threonine-protein kinase [Mangrovitalea sediminis]|uniref:serine/threonine-protein kinase n=1 Tax=Mangrovitalea sediminis TaxID=1982043 RepID=UPI000BE5A6D1|nr:serine/threonine-protein kinase [Mangrovitalea sediminis]
MSEETRIQPSTENDTPSFGRYRLIGELGRGAMGIVYRCVDPDFERTVAIKVLHPELLVSDSSGEFRLRFRNEMRAAGRVSHPNIVNVYDAGEQDGRPYFVMEFVEGQELGALLKDEGPMALAPALAMADGILAGLGQIHSLGVVHRDLKPANIFVTADGRPKLADFGVAKLESTELTQVGTVIGSPRYMSPEQCQGLAVDQRSDLFAAGVVLFEMVTGERCFDGASANTIMQQIMMGSQERIRRAGKGLPDVLKPVLLKALARDPEKRFQSAEEFRQALSSIDTGASAHSAAGSRRPWLIAIAAALVLAVGAGTWFAMHQPRQTPQAVTTSTPAAPVAPTSPPADNVAPVSTVTPAQPTVQALTLANQQKVQLLLQVAQAHEMTGRLVTPSGSSAYDAYELVLKIDPHNSKALAGLRTLQAKVGQRVEQLLAQGNKSDALAEAKAGVAAFPTSQTLQNLSRQLQ